MSATETIVYIAKSLDGFIADADGGLDWLSEGQDGTDDHGFADFIAGIDAIVMGRVTFETVMGFGGDWPYPCPVFVASTWPDPVPPSHTAHATRIHGTPDAILANLHARGLTRLYIDGGDTVRRFLAADRVDRLILTRVPVLLGAGIPLFGALPAPLRFTHRETRNLTGGLVQSHYARAA